MEFINTVLGTPLGFVFYFAYQILGNFGFAIIAFAIIVKIPLFPVLLIAHLNSIRLLKLQPDLGALRHRFAGDKDGLHEAQYELFKKEKYSPMVGIFPLLISLLLIMGMLQVMYHPLQHMLRLDRAVIDSLIAALHGINGNVAAYAQQLAVLEAFSHPENIPVFQAALASFQDGDAIILKLQEVQLQFLGLNLGITPSLLSPSPELIIVLLSGVVAFSFCTVQNAISPGALSQGRRTNLGLTIFTVALSVYFALALPVGVGLYWTVGNLASIGLALFLCFLYPPKKLASAALLYIQSTRKSSGQLRNERLQNKELRAREKLDAAKFREAKKQVVFYAISGGQYKFYKAIIDYLCDNSDIVIHYLTNDPNDTLFDNHQKQIVPYYAGQQKAISLMLRLNTDILVTTVPDLQSFHLKKSIVRDDIEYIHTFHGLTSTHLVYKEKAFDHFDTLFCVGPHCVSEIRRREAFAGLPKKKLVKVGYGVYDQLVAAYDDLRDRVNPRPRILIAPSWQVDNILDLCIEPLLESFAGKGFDVVVRPHPQYIKLFPERINALQERFSGENSSISFELDFLGNDSIFMSDIVITDWSNIGYEFAYCTLKPCIFINTPMKIMNPNYERYGLVPLDISLRDKVGVSVEVADVGDISSTAAYLLKNKDSFKSQILEVIAQYLYYPGRSGEAAGVYILRQLNAGNNGVME